MKIVFLMASVIISSLIAQLFLPWWIIGIICFALAYVFNLSKFTSFAACLLAIFILWMIKAWVSDANFDVPISQLLGSLFGGISNSAIYFMTGMVGGLSAGLAGLLGSWTKILSQPKI